MIVSIKRNFRRIAGFAAVAVGVAILLGVLLFSGGNTAASAAAGTQNFSAANAQERIQFIAQYGWEVEEDPVEVAEVAIPAQFNEVYETYNAIQKKQGFDLSRYQGKRVKRWCYQITNYPGYDGEVRVNLLVCDNKVVGGDVSSVALDGFMHGFTLP
ncbi:DUF4830 domain-containing protein [Solibaculum mannosilyticum]|uniref:DUF4830 domain-containing protein n=1 Tax=Solibaculum mannosilyticum TaxID=2780922 RepID=UPI0034C0231E